MTTVAWDGKTLAADSQCTHYGTPLFHAEKLLKHDGHLYGFSGAQGACLEVKKWIIGGSDENKKPQDLDDVNVIKIDPEKRIWLACQKLNFWTHNHPFWGLGSGVDYALGAMHAGVGAVQAVEIAKILDINTGGEVRSISFED